MCTPQRPNSRKCLLFQHAWDQEIFALELVERKEVFMHAESLVRAFTKPCTFPSCASSSVVGQKRERQEIRDGFKRLLPEQANPGFLLKDKTQLPSMISPEVVRQVRVMILLECAKRERDQERGQRYHCCIWSELQLRCNKNQIP